MEDRNQDSPFSPVNSPDIEGQIRTATVEDVATTKIANEVASIDYTRS